MYQIIDYSDKIKHNDETVTLIKQMGFYSGFFVEVDVYYVYLFGLREIGLNKSMFILKEVD